MAYIQFNKNPIQRVVGDCVVRAIATAENIRWEDAYNELCILGFQMCDMPNSNEVWGAYMRKHGYTRFIIPDSCPDCYSVEEFCMDYPHGIYVVGTGTHAIAIIDGDYYDIWDCGQEVPVYAWKKGVSKR